MSDTKKPRIRIRYTDSGCCGPYGRETDCYYFGKYEDGKCPSNAVKLCLKGAWFELMGDNPNGNM